MLLKLVSLALIGSALAREIPVPKEPEVMPAGYSGPTAAAGSVETQPFAAEVNKMMDIIINSIYKSKDVFLRELISNSADALDKVRFLGLTDPSLLATNPVLNMSIVVDRAQHTLSIRDSGIGMTKETLRTHLGTIAKSGTGDFKKALNASNTDLIGQFGVGFYSAFLVASHVTVISKHNDDDQYVWESDSQSDFKIYKDPRGNTLQRGTEIIMQLKSDSLEFEVESKLKGLIAKYSEFVNFPIYIWSTKVVVEIVPVEESVETPVEESEVKSGETESSEKDVSEDSADENVEDITETPKEDTPTEPVAQKTIKKNVSDWELVNTNKPIWTRPPSEVSKEEYNAFFKSLFKSSDDPIGYSHFQAEGDTEFKALIFIPKKPSDRFMQPDEKAQKNVKLFVRRVFITEVAELLPKWLSFMKVVVDSNDLPLSVSRDTLQRHPSLKIIRKKLLGKCLDLFQSQSEEEETFKAFWKTYRMAMKYGVHDLKSGSNFRKLVKLLRFDSTSSDFTGLEAYVSRMRENQPQIYYVVTNTLSEAKVSPLVETLVARGFEVLIFLDPVDEFVVQNTLKTFAKIPLQNVGKPGLKYGDESEETAAKEAEMSKKFQPLIDHLKEVLAGKVADVRISTQLTSTAAAVLPGLMGFSAVQERLMMIQNAGNEDDSMTKFYRSQARVLEINPAHPIIAELLDRVVLDQKDSIALIPHVLFETAAIGSGWDPRDPREVSLVSEKLIRKFLGVEQTAEAIIDVEVVKQKSQDEVVEEEEEIDDEPVDDEHFEL